MAGSSDAYKSYRGQIPNTANYKTDLPESVHQRMMRANEMATKRANARKAAAALALPAGSIDIRGYFGDERTGIRKTAGQKVASALKAKPALKVEPAAVVRTTTDMKSSPAPAKSAFKGNWTGAAPTAMQARAGKKDSLTPVQRQARMMAEQQVGSRKTGGGQSASAGFKSLGDMGRRAAGALGFGGAKSSAKKSGGGRNLSGKP